MEKHWLLTDVQEGVVTITFNRPEARNAMTGEIRKVLCEQLLALDADPSVRSLVFRGVGGSFAYELPHRNRFECVFSRASMRFKMSPCPTTYCGIPRRCRTTKVIAGSASTRSSVRRVERARCTSSSSSS